MNERKKLAIGVAAGFIVGMLSGQVMPSWSTAPAEPAPTTQPASPHGDMAGGHEAEATGAVMTGADPCEMNCSVERPELEARLQKNPQDVEALIALGSCDLDMGDPKQGVDRLTQAVVLSEEPRQLVKAGVSLAKVAETDKAFAAFEKALVGNPRDSEALYRAGLLAFHNMGNNERAAHYWTRYLEVEPNAPNADLIRRAIEHLSTTPSTAPKPGAGH